MVQILARELDRNEDRPVKLPYEEPLILEDPVPRSQLMHVYVLWKRWENVKDELERSSIILDAYAQSRGEQAARNISVALGLTPTQAESMDLKIS